MTAPDDLIRRGDVLAIVFPDACSEARKGALCLHPSCENVRYSPILEAIRALPADPVAEAAGKLAEATEAHETAARVMDHAMDAWRAAPVHRRHELGLVADNAIELKARAERAYHVALHAYRAAVAARAKETR